MLPAVGLILDLALGLFELVPFWVNESIRFPTNLGGAWANPLTACPRHPFPGTPLAGGKHKISGSRVLAPLSPPAPFLGLFKSNLGLMNTLSAGFHDSPPI